MRRHTKEFRRKAVERLKGSDNVVALARELGVHRRLLYHWGDEAERLDGGGYSATSRLEDKVRELQQALAEKTLELDFFKGALQKVEARRRSSSSAGEKASTTKSEK
jgi:transposase-like protein